MHNDSRHYVEGLPIYVLVNETDIRFTDVSECFKVLDQVSINDHYVKGRRIFRKMEQQYWADDFANAKEREYVREIIQTMRGHFDEPIEDNDMYLFLQESKRHVLFRFGDAFGETDGAGGADETAEMATDAFSTDDLRFAVFIESYRLMAAVGA